MSAVDDIAAYLAYLKTGGNRIDQIIFDELPNGEEMTATDGLRRLLDERGVEWMPSAWSAKDETFYKVGNTGFLATEMSGGRMKVCIEGYVTPEQAIEATLGRGECTDTGRYCFTCSECGWTANEPHHVLGGFWPNYCPNCGRSVKA